MKDRNTAIKYQQGQRLLFDSSLKAIPFNVTMSTLLAIYLLYNNGPKSFILYWLSAMFLISATRMIHCRIVLKKDLFKTAANFHLKIFLFQVLLTGLVWTSVYFLCVPFITEFHMYAIILVYGGMSAGATTSLAVYLPSFYLYVFSIFLPVVIYNYSFLEFNHAVMATMYIFYLLAISLIAESYQRVLRTIFLLTEQNKSLMGQFEVMSITDSLTGLHNRRHFSKTIQDEYNRAKRNQQTFVFISMDIDNFKLINDNFGHPFGDLFLIYTADYLKNYLRRANDIIFRLGGDEFAGLLVNISEEDALSICKLMRNNFIKEPKFDYEPQDSVHQNIMQQVSMSMGIVYVTAESVIDLDQIIEIADKLLYQAKHEGKNRIKFTKCV